MTILEATRKDEKLTLRYSFPDSVVVLHTPYEGGGHHRVTVSFTVLEQFVAEVKEEQRKELARELVHVGELYGLEFKDGGYWMKGKFLGTEPVGVIKKLGWSLGSRVTDETKWEVS